MQAFIAKVMSPYVSCKCHVQLDKFAVDLSLLNSCCVSRTILGMEKKCKDLMSGFVKSPVMTPDRGSQYDLMAEFLKRSASLG